jgi:outer membrane protein insertion porin family
MRHRVRLLLAAFAVFEALHAASAQKFQPKTIQFQGAPEYSTAELLDATGLKKSAILGYTDMQDYSKRLLGSGVFASVAFKFDGQDLIFLLIPSSDIYPIHLENIPLTPGPNLDAELHEQLPLYHGKVPAQGGLNDDVRAALEKMLAAEGLQTSVIATTAADLHTHLVNAVSYSIAAPPVQIGVVRIDGVSDAFQGEVRAVLNEAAKDPFSTTGSAINLERVVEQFYGDHGYAAAKVQVTHSGDPSLASGAIVVPFAIQVQEGRVYKVDSIHLPPGTPVTQAEIDKALDPSSAGPVIGIRVRSIWYLISQRYRAKGNLDCKVTPHAAFDDADATVSYTADVEPGPVYHLAFVKFDNVTDELRTLLIHNWEMMPGDPFDESYVATFITKVQQQDPVLRRSLSGVKVTFDVTANPDTHDVNVVIHLAR